MAEGLLAFGTGETDFNKSFFCKTTGCDFYRQALAFCLKGGCGMVVFFVVLESTDMSDLFA